MDLSTIPLNVVIPLGVVLIILVAIMWILYYKNRQLNWILASEKKRFAQYVNGIENLKKSESKDPEKDFEILNRFIRAFFKEYYQLDFSLTYLELSEYFKKQNNKEYEKFCRIMSDKNYSGEKTKKSEIKKLTDDFYKILISYREKHTS